MSDKITLLLEENLIKQAKIKAINDGTSISEVCRVLLDAWQNGLFGYEEFTSRDNLPHESGVYIMADGDKILYIGESYNIHNRLVNHEHNKSLRKTEKPIIFWFKIKTAVMADVERLCISLLEPELNIKKPSSWEKSKYILFHFERPSIEKEYFNNLIDVRPDERTAMLERWYQAYTEKEQG